MRWLLLLFAVACGARSAAPVINRTSEDFTAARTHLCEQARRLDALECSPWNQLERTLLDNCSVVESIYIAGLDTCVDATTCEAARTCAERVRHSGAPYRGPTAACRLDKDSDIPAGVTADELAHSYGLHDRTFADSPSSKAHPIEVCGMPAQLDYLTRVTCADGSHPFTDRNAAEQARTGNVGTGGRCGRVVDRYAVHCPEHTYAVFIEPYRCQAR